MKRKTVVAIVCFFIGLMQSDADGRRDTVNVWAIDMTVLETDGQYYAVWSGWDRYYYNCECSGQFLYIAPMTFHNEKPYVRLGRRVLLSVPELPWELRQCEHISLLEGPSALYHGDDFFILYSTRGSWTEHYKIGQLRLKSRKHDPLDPQSWVKKSTPVFTGVQEKDKAGYCMYGVGHASYVQSPDGKEYWIDYHSKTLREPGWKDRKVFMQKFDFNDDGDPVFGMPADSSVPMKRPSGETCIEKEDGVSCPEETFMNPVYNGADPWILRHDGKYYTCRSGGRSIWVTESRFMTRFEDGQNFAKARKRVWTLPDENTGKWNIRQLWAPEIHFIDGRWYIFYAAGRQTRAPYWEQRAGVLISEDGPFGPYFEHDDKPLFTGD